MRHLHTFFTTHPQSRRFLEIQQYIPFTKQEDIDLLKELVETGKYKPLMDRSYPLDDIVTAYKYVETGQKVGNVVIDVKHA